MRTVTATFADGSSHKYASVPDEATPEQVLARLAKDFPGKQVTKLDGGKPAQTPQDWTSRSGYMGAAEQQEGWSQFSDSKLPGDQVNPVPAFGDVAAGGSSTAPAPAPSFGTATSGSSTTAPPLGPAGPEAPKSEPFFTRETGYGLAGGIGGAVVGMFTPAPGVGSFVLGTAGSAVGTYIGAFKDAKAAGLDDELAYDAATRAAGIDIAFSVGGGIVLKSGGKVIGLLSKTGPVTKLFSMLGFKPRLAVDDKALLTGRQVFEDTTQAELEAGMKEGVSKVVKDSGVDVTARGLSGVESAGEAIARSGARVTFERGAAKQEAALAAELKATRDALRDGAPRAGESLQKGLDLAEERVKSAFGPVFEKITQTAGAGTEIVDIRPLIGKAKAILAAEERQSIKTLTPAEKSLLENVASGRGLVSPAEAHNIQSAFGRRVRDMESSTAMDSARKARLAEFADGARNALGDAFEKAVQSGLMKPEDLALVKRAREMYREMATTLYDPALRRARAASEERVAGVVGQVGDSERVDALRRLVTFGDKVDNLGAPAAAAGARAAPGTALALRPVVGAVSDLPVPAGVRTTNDLARLVRVGENPNVAATGLERVGRELGLSGRGESTRALFEATIRDARASFFAKHMGTPELMASFAKKAQGEDYQRTLKALFPDQADRLAIERMSQVAQVLQRTSTDSTGLRAALGQIGQFLGGMGGRVAGTLTAGVLPELMAKAYLTPALRPDLPKTAAWLLNASQRSAAPTINEIPPYVLEFFREATREPERIE
jgi:hypothetical protein